MLKDRINHVYDDKPTQFETFVAQQQRLCTNKPEGKRHHIHVGERYVGVTWMQKQWEGGPRRVQNWCSRCVNLRHE